MGLEKRAVKKNEAMRDHEIVSEISKITGQYQYVVKDILNAFVDIYEREVLTTGAWKYSVLPSVTRHVLKEKINVHPETHQSALYPSTCYLKAKVSDRTKQLHREIFRNVNNELNGTTRKNWHIGREV